MIYEQGRSLDERPREMSFNIPFWENQIVYVVYNINDDVIGIGTDIEKARKILFERYSEFEFEKYNEKIFIRKMKVNQLYYQ